MLAGENEDAPVKKWTFYQQTRLSLDGEYLRYDLLMPNYGDIVLEKFTDEFIKDGICGLIWFTECPAWILAGIDHRGMLLHFDRRDGRTHTELTMPYQVYNVIEL